MTDEATRLALAEMLKRNGFTSRDDTYLQGGTFGVIDAILETLRAIPQEPVAKRPFVFAVRRAPENGPDQWRLFMDEEDAREAANQLDGDYEGLYRVGDRRSAIAALAPAGWRSRNILGPENCWVFTKDQPQPHPQYIDEPLYAAPIIQSSDGRTDEAKAREAAAVVGVAKSLLGGDRTTMAADQAGVGSERSSPSEPIAQGQREAIADLPMYWTGRAKALTLIRDARDASSEDYTLGQIEAFEDCAKELRAILATLPQPPVGACREALEGLRTAFATDAYRLTQCLDRKDWTPRRSHIEGNRNIFTRAVKRLEEILAALAPSAQEGETLETLIREYARDLRRNSSGGDDYPWEWAKATADYLEVLIERASPHSRPERGA